MGKPLSDCPTAVDWLGYGAYAEALAGLLLSSSDNPLTVGIHGDWGSGKTSLMAMLEKRVNPLDTLANLVRGNAGRSEQDLAHAIGASQIQEAKSLYHRFVSAYRNWQKADFDPKQTELKATYEGAKESLYALLYGANGVAVDTVWFNTWEHDDEVAVWSALLDTLTDHIRDNPRYPASPTQIERLEKLVEQHLQPISIAVSALTRGVVPADAVKAVLKPEQSRSGYRAKLQQIVEDTVVGLGSSARHQNRLLFFIDDLDRCAPTTVISLLERLKVFFDVNSCIFVLAASEEVIASGIEAKGIASGYQQYFEGKGSKYLEKIIQIPFRIPPLTVLQRKRLLEELPVDEMVRQVVISLLDYFAPNPRQLKRFVNSVALLDEIRKSKSEHGEAISVSLSDLATFALIQFEWEDVHRAFARYGFDFYEQLWQAVSTTGTPFRTSPDDSLTEREQAIQQAAQDTSLCRLLIESRFLSSAELASSLSLTQLTPVLKS